MSGFQTKLFGGASEDMEEADENERTDQKTPDITQVNESGFIFNQCYICRCIHTYVFIFAHIYVYIIHIIYYSI